MTTHKPELFRARDYLHPRYWGMWFILALLRVIAVMPYSSQLWIGRHIGHLVQHLSGKRQRIADINLALCFADIPSRQREKIKRESYESLGISLMELAMCWWWKPQRLEPLVEIRGLEHIETCLQQGQGVILLSGHFTSLEIGARLLAMFTPLQVMYRTQKNRLFDSLLYRKRQHYFVDVISRKNTRALLKGIKKQIPTWYAPDQDFSHERNVFAPFFGVPTATITASARMAQSTGAAMLPFYPERKRDGSGYTLWIEPPLQNFPSGDDMADASAINASIERFIRNNPEQYMWVHQRFKTRPPGEEKIY